MGASKLRKKENSPQKTICKMKKTHALHKYDHLILQATTNKDDYYNILWFQSAITNLNPQFTITFNYE